MMRPMSAGTRLCGSLAVLAFGSIAVVPIASAGDREDVVALRVAELEARGECDEAIAVHRQAGEAGTRDARIALVASRCQIRRRDYPAALVAAEEAKQLSGASTASSAAIELELGIARYHLGQLDAADSSLAAARAAGAAGPLLDLYTGLLLLQREDVRAAALSLERARRADARLVEPVASYYAFLAWRSLEEAERARAALDRVRETDPDGPWIAEAERMLGRRVLGPPPRAWADVRVGLEYDSNPVLLANGVSANDVEGVAHKDDGRGVWAVDGGVELFRTENWSGGLLAAYAGSGHFSASLHEFDLHYPQASGWIDRKLGDSTTLRVRYDYGHAWVDYDPYLSANRIAGSLFHVWDERGTTEVTVSGFLYDFRFTPDAPFGVAPPPVCQDLDRDGAGATAEVEHRYPTGWRDLELYGGYRFTHYDSEGCEYSFDSHQVRAGFDLDLGWDVELQAHAAFTYQPYENQSAFLTLAESNIVRRDRIWQTGVGLERPITDRVSVLGSYRYTDTGSNTNVYDYERHVVGVYLRVRFD